MPPKSNTYADGQPGRAPWDLNPPMRKAPGIRDVFRAGLEEESEIGRALYSETFRLDHKDRSGVDSAFEKPFDEIEQRYREHADAFHGVHTQPHHEAMVADIQRGWENDRMLDDAGLLGFLARLGGSAVSLTSLFPAGRVYKGGKAAYRTWKTGASHLFWGSVSSGYKHSIYHLVDPTQDIEDTIRAIMNDGLLSLGEGKARGVITNGQSRAFQKAFSGDLSKLRLGHQEARPEHADLVPSSGSAGPGLSARQVDAVSGAGSAVAENDTISGFQTTPSATARKTIETLAAVPNGRSETTVNRYRNGPLPKALGEIDKNYRAARNAGLDVTRADFNAAVGRAARRGDGDPDGNPYVEAAAKALRSDLLNPLVDEAIGAGLLPAQLQQSAARRVLLRRWDNGLVAADKERFETAIRPFVRNQVDRAVEADDKSAAVEDLADTVITEAVKKVVGDYLGGETARHPHIHEPDPEGGAGETGLLPDADRTAVNPEGRPVTDSKGAQGVSGVGGDNTEGETEKSSDAPADVWFESAADRDAYVDEIVDHIYNQVAGRPADTWSPPWEIPVSHGPLNGEVLDIPDALADAFLDTDAVTTAQNLARTLPADIDLTKAFGRADLKDQLDGVRADYAALRTEARTEAERQDLSAREARDIRQVEALRDMARGTFRAAGQRSDWATFSRLAEAWSYVSTHGDVAFSSLSDMVSDVTRAGLHGFMQEGLAPLQAKTRKLRISRRDAAELGTIIDFVLRTHLAELADLHEPYATGVPADRIARNVETGFSRRPFTEHWNDLARSVVSIMTGNKIARLLLSNEGGTSKTAGVGSNLVPFAGLNRHERRYLETLGIDETVGARIAVQLDKHGVQERGVIDLNLAAWNDGVARRAMAAAVNWEVDGAASRSGKPLWARSNTGKLMLLFKRLGTSADAQLHFADLENFPRQMARFLLLGSSFGMMVSYLKSIEAGQFEAANHLTVNPDQWIADGLKRTGIARVLTELSDTGVRHGLPVGIRTTRKLAADETQAADPLMYVRPDGRIIRLGPALGAFLVAAKIAAEAPFRDGYGDGSIMSATRN